MDKSPKFKFKPGDLVIAVNNVREDLVGTVGVVIRCNKVLVDFRVITIITLAGTEDIFMEDHLEIFNG